VTLSFDPEHPPAEPPPGCDPVLWRLAYQVHVDHRPGVDAFCLARTCRAAFSAWPCQPARLAAQGFLGAGSTPAGGA
jgi:hypothetical protein